MKAQRLGVSLPALALLAALPLALSGCATGAIYGASPYPAANAGRVPEGAGPVPGVSDTGSPASDAGATGAAAATTALLTQSRSARASGDLDAAAATVERALGIAPEDARLWVELAEIRGEQGDTRTAADLARKALTLTSSESELAARARRLIR